MVHPYRLAVMADTLIKAETAFAADPSPANARAVAEAKRNRYARLLGVDPNRRDRRTGGRF